MITSMHSPLIYDRDGNPVGGGSNIFTASVRCNNCKKRWGYSQTELEIAQDAVRNFEFLGDVVRYKDFQGMNFPNLEKLQILLEKSKL